MQKIMNILLGIFLSLIFKLLFVPLIDLSSVLSYKNDFPFVTLITFPSSVFSI